MARPPVRTLALMLSLFVFASCSEDTTPTEPAATPDLSVAQPSQLWLPNHWTAKAPLAGPTFGVAAAVANNAAGRPILYALGGTDCCGGSGFNIQAYDLVTNTWTGRNSSVYVFNTNGVGKIGGNLYVSGGAWYSGAGGLSLSSQLWAYDVARDRLIRKADAPKRTADGVTGVIDGKLYVLPGTCAGDFWPDPHYCEQPDKFRQLWRYDPVANAWTILASAPHFHAHGAGGVINGKFYVAGGYAHGVAIANLDVYDPVANKWTALASMPAPRRVAVGAVQNGKLWVIGVDGSNRLTYAYDPVTRRWATRASLPLGGATQAAAPITDRWGQAHILVVGGETLEKPAPSELYTP